MAHNIKKKVKKGIFNNELWSFCREANMVCYSETHLGCLKKFDFLSRKTSLMGKTEKLHIYIYF
jgi:hypothetical protein